MLPHIYETATAVESGSQLQNQPFGAVQAMDLLQLVKDLASDLPGIGRVFQIAAKASGCGLSAGESAFPQISGKISLCFRNKLIPQKCLRNVYRRGNDIFRLGAEPQKSSINGQGRVKQCRPFLSNTESVSNTFRSSRANRLIKRRELFHADLIGDARLLGLAELGNQFQLGAGQNQVLHLEFGNGNPIEDCIQIFLDDIIEIVSFLMETVEGVMELQGAHGDVLGIDHLLAVIDSYTDTARTYVGDHGVALLELGSVQSLDHLFIDVGFFLAVLQYCNVQTVAHLQLVHHQSPVLSLSQGCAGDDLGLLNIIRAQGRCEFRQHTGKFPQTVKADVAAGKHVMAQTDRVFQPIQSDNISLGPLRDPHPHIVGADLDDSGGAGSAFLIQGISLL